MKNGCDAGDGFQEFVDHAKSINQIQVLAPGPLRELLYLGVMENLRSGVKLPPNQQ